MREKRVDASDGLLRIQGVHFVFRLAILFWDSEDAQRLQGLEGIGGFRVDNADANVKIIAAVQKPQCGY